MCLYRQLISQPWRCILPLRHFVGVWRPREDSVCHGFHNREYGTGNWEPVSKDEANDGRDVDKGFSKSQGFGRNFESGGQFGRSSRSKSQNHGDRGRKPKRIRMRGNGRNGFRMPEFDPGHDQLKKIFESQMDSSDPIDEFDFGEGGPIEGNFRDDDDSELEDFHKNASIIATSLW